MCQNGKEFMPRGIEETACWVLSHPITSPFRRDPWPSALSCGQWSLHHRELAEWGTLGFLGCECQCARVPTLNHNGSICIFCQSHSHSKNTTVTTETPEIQVGGHPVCRDTVITGAPVSQHMLPVVYMVTVHCYIRPCVPLLPLHAHGAARSKANQEEGIQNRAYTFPESDQYLSLGTVITIHIQFTACLPPVSRSCLVAREIADFLLCRLFHKTSRALFAFVSLAADLLVRSSSLPAHGYPKAIQSIDSQCL